MTSLLGSKDQHHRTLLTSDDWRRLDERIEGLSSEIEALARQDKGCERLMTAGFRSCLGYWVFFVGELLPSRRLFQAHVRDEP